MLADMNIEQGLFGLQVQSMRDSQAKELAVMYEETLTARSEQEYSMAVLRLENQRLKDEIAAYTVVCDPHEIPRPRTRTSNSRFRPHFTIQTSRMLASAMDCAAVHRAPPRESPVARTECASA